MENMGTLIKKLRTENNMTLEELGSKVGVGKSTVRKWENGMIANMKRDKIAKVASALNVSPAYLMGWESPANSSSELYERLEQDGVTITGKSEQQWELSGEIDDRTLNLLKIYLDLDDDGKDTVDYIASKELKRIGLLSEARKTIERLREEIKKNYTPKRIYTYLQRIACAGTGFYFDDIPSDTIEAPYMDGADFIIGVNGDSMEPTFNDGDKIYVEKRQIVEIGEIGIFIVNNECFVKEAGEDGLISHNPKYDIIPGSANIICIGKVLGKVQTS